MHYVNNTELSSHEETRSQFNGGTGAIKLGIDVHQDFYVVVMQVGGSNPKPPQLFQKEAFLHWAGRLKQKSGAEVPRGLCSVRIWLCPAAQIKRAGDSLLRGLPAEVG